MQAIQVKWHAPSNTRSARYTAEAPAGKVTVKLGNIPAGTGVDAGFRYAAETLCRKMQWDGELLGGTLANGDQVFVFDHPLSRKESQ